MLLSVFAIAFWSVDILEIHLAPGSRQLLSYDGAPGGGPLLFAAPAPLGRGYETRIIHSVQLTPVVDRYRVQEGKIWGWQELVLSHSAGLPFHRPERGRFMLADPWMVVEGGGAFWHEIRYRVGNARFGKNSFFYPSMGVAALWRDMPDRALTFTVKRAPLLVRLLRHENRLGFVFSPHSLAQLTEEQG